MAVIKVNNMSRGIMMVRVNNDDIERSVVI